eukprot:CAMPEP_0176082208 /NCGR_PEP_ID=MMETSP0120_2-20121206/41121_1 /TAXON_ID=160619 /ORGANISM="Kryptoperidinium foliaceum, Strain CCMP 1326" /LENGTH=72 /DNA_ID=CAMNT_0017415975 /DNA_START=77 /DNA_END=295 /DNA_ORIENTATION=+
MSKAGKSKGGNKHSHCGGARLGRRKQKRSTTRQMKAAQHNAKMKQIAEVKASAAGESGESGQVQAPEKMATS